MKVHEDIEMIKEREREKEREKEGMRKKNRGLGPTLLNKVVILSFLKFFKIKF